MEKQLILIIPVYVCYIVLLGMIMFKRRFRATQSGQIKISYFKSYQSEAPYELRVIQNHFSNQFEIPVLFFITCLAAIQLNAVSIVTVILGWSFFISRIIHSYIHLGSNNVRLRALVYSLGILIVLAMWIQIYCL